MGKSSRLRWDASDPIASGAASRRVMARTYAYLYGSGALLLLASLLLPSDGGRVDVGVAAPGVAAFGVGCLMLTVSRHFPDWVWSVAPAVGGQLIGIAMASGGPGDAVGYAMLFFWVVLASFYFFGRRWAYANLAFVVATVFGVTLVRPEIHLSTVWLLTSFGALIVAGSLISRMRERIDELVRHLRANGRRQASIATLGEMAVEGHHPDTLMELVVTSVVAGLGVDRCEIVEHVGAEGHLTVRAASGTVEGPAATTRVVELRGADRSFGALIVTTAAPRMFTGDELRFVDAMANVLADAIARHRTQEEMSRRARQDVLTGLPNRMLFEERVAAALERSRATGRDVAIFFVDIDGFKAINDSFGHAAGDELLVALVPRLREPLMATDTLARFGGDEYVALCEGLSGVEALPIAERMRAAIDRPVRFGEYEHRGTASIGVATGSGTDATVAGLLRDADTAMYRAKETGANRCVLFDETLRRAVVSRTEMEHALRGALDAGELSLHYQPIVTLPAGRIIGAEALLRWTHPELGAVSPGEFIPLAERTGLIVEIGRWVLRTACEQMAVWERELGERAPRVLSVNLSAVQLGAPSLVDDVERILRETGVRPRAIALELTETALAEDHRSAADLLHRLRALGPRIVLDDFGSGYSSLSYLDTFPIDTLKVDRSFMRGLGTERRSDSIVRAIAGIARSFDMHIVAEGIETAEQAAAVHALGCDLAQGFFFARPMSAAALGDLLDPPAQVVRLHPRSRVAT